jgi:plastocyanin
VEEAAVSESRFLNLRRATILAAGFVGGVSWIACGDLKSPTEPGGPPGATVVVEARADLTFVPAVVTIRAGDTVTWRNVGGGLHNVREDADRFRCATGCDGVAGGNGDPSATAWSVSRTFDTVGAVNYYCDVHGAPGGRGMAGRIVVNASTTAAVGGGAR